LPRPTRLEALDIDPTNASSEVCCGIGFEFPDDHTEDIRAKGGV
jgi:hypothetical protein